MRSVYVIFPEVGKVAVEEEAVTELEPGEALCIAEKSLISTGTELYCLQGMFDPGTNWEGWVRYPFRPGYSMVGRVATVGTQVTDLRPGDRVAAWTSHQAVFKVRQDDVYIVPRSVSSEDAAWSILGVTTQMAVRRAEHCMGDSVGVVGLGILGQLVVQYLALSGARRIVAIDPARARLDRAKMHGATHTIAADASQARQGVNDITEGRFLDVIYDVTGQARALAPCIRLVRKLGKVILLGDTPTPTQQHLGPGVVSDSVAILGIHASMSPALSSEFNPWTRREMTTLFFDYLTQGRISVSDLVTHRYSPVDAPQAYAALLRDRSEAVGVIFDWTLLGGPDSRD